VAVRTTVDIPETLQHKSYESGKALEQVYCERKQRKVTGPLVARRFRVAFHAEPNGLGASLREATAPFRSKTASKWIVDCYLVAFAKASRAKLVTLDKTLVKAAQSQKCGAVVPA
jgi:predicted nucleic acid-binding protein